MPTGYTYKVESGEITTLEEFALECARAFGACVSLRDSDAPIPKEFKANTYNQVELEKALERKEQVLSYSPEKCDQEARLKFTKTRTEYNEYMQKLATENQRHEDMIEKVKAWKVPSALHVDLKNFMLKQLRTSIRGDSWRQEPVPLNGIEWRLKELAKLEKDIQYHSEKMKEENERVAERNLWVKQLRESLK